MTKQSDMHIRLRVALASGLLAILVGGPGGGAYAASMSFTPQDASGGTINRLDELTELGPSGSNPLPGGFTYDNGTDPPPPDYRAHSDVPDLPDGGNPQATSTGTGTWPYSEPRRPYLSDTFDTDFSDTLTRPESTLPYDSPVNSVLGPAASTIPGPGSVLLFGAAGLMATGRRRRR